MPHHSHLRSNPGYSEPVPSAGPWEDGGWICREEVEAQREDFFADDFCIERLLAFAIKYHDDKERHLPIYGEIGELYAERRFGMTRSRPGQAGSDGRIGNLIVEVKTISPGKRHQKVRVKRSGNFGALILVKIDSDHRIDAKLVLRKSLPKGKGKWMTVSWSEYSNDADSLLSLPS